MNPLWPAGAKAPNGRYDLAVVGAGSAGFAAAIAAADLGARVALIGHGVIGGTCVNTGCVPSKTLIRAMESLHHAKIAGRFAGIRADGCIEDWAAVVRHKDELVASLRQAKYAALLPNYNTIAYLEGWARLAEGGVAIDGNRLTAGRVIIATGASPALPPIPGIDGVPHLTSTTALELKRLPKSLLVIGGGYIGCELGQLFARAGVAVTIVDIMPILSTAEPEIAKALGRYLRDEGLVIRDGVRTKAVRKTERGIVLDISDDSRDEMLEAEQVLIATGRRPNTAGMDLEDAGIEILPNGGIKMDDHMRTTKAGIYAAGDVTGRDPFVYMAAYGAKIAAENALNDDSRRYDPTAMPSVVFTDPQLASVGLTEEQARKRRLHVKTTVMPLDYVSRALAARDTRGMIKLVADSDSDKLLGAHILAPEGADSIQTAAIAIKCGMTVQDLADMIFPYLTTVEGLKLAAQSFTRNVAQLSCCAG
ncbi:MAG: mercury(II) reductase [Alphaproteobacteria bacterium]|nr:mercury(II) reductase [Alphaproteobacteria bacterium]